MSAPMHHPVDDKIARAAYWRLRLAEDDLSHLDRMQFELWLQADPDHAQCLAQAEEAWRTVEQQACSADMIALRGEALADARQAKARRRRQVHIRRGLAAVAATLVVAVGAGGVWMLAASKTYLTNIGERRVVVLADGSRLSLDADTSVRVKYTNDRRQLWLERGRVKFDVAKNPLRPFTVAANGRVVVATGTQFSVELLQRQMRVDLYEGHVAVLSAQAARDRAVTHNIRGDQPGAQYLAPGQELIATAPEDNGTVRNLGEGEAPSWENGQLVFVDDRLSTIVERANRYSDQKLVLANAETGDLRLSGVFAEGNTAAIVAAITTILPVRAVDSDDGTHLSVIRRQNNFAAPGVGSEP